MHTEKLFQYQAHRFPIPPCSQAGINFAHGHHNVIFNEVMPQHGEAVVSTQVTDFKSYEISKEAKRVPKYSTTKAIRASTPVKCPN